MGHPLLDEFCRAKSLLRPEFFRRCQRIFRAEVCPQLDEVENLRAIAETVQAENARLVQQLEELQAKATRKRRDVTEAFEASRPA